MMNNFIKNTGVVGFLLVTGVVQAGEPLWTFTPLTATTVAVPAGTTSSVQYTVTNQASRPKSLKILPTSGLSQTGACDLAPKGHAGNSCTLTLNITGNDLPSGGVQNGPKLCETDPDGSPNPNQCYQPDRVNVLHIVKLPNLSIGQPFQGGVVACLNGGLNNLIAASGDNNNGNSIIWGNFGTQTNATSTTDGAANTAQIVSVLGAGSYAAKVCNDYEIDDQGNTPCQPGNTCYDDWFLPALSTVAGTPPSPTSQLDCLWFNKDAIGGFDNFAFYWSSTESGPFSAWAKFFLDGSQGNAGKLSTNLVRCVRAFTP